MKCLTFSLSESIVARFFFSTSFDRTRSHPSYLFKFSNGVTMFCLLINVEAFSFDRVDDLLNDERIFSAHVNLIVPRIIFLSNWGEK